MSRKILESCPTCGGGLVITEVQCTRCDTEIRAHYHPGDFSSLSEEQSTFLRIFVTSRGNLSEVEKRLGVSYPTVRAKLDEVIDRLTTAEQAAAATTAPGESRIDALVRQAMDRIGPTLDTSVRAAVERLGARQGGADSGRGEPTPAPAPTPTPLVANAPQSEPVAPPQPMDRRAILDAVARGELSAAEGLERIRTLGRGGA